ncbi:cyclic nucleotide-binding domain-containing protein [Streptomyces sp. NPDC005507]|uniref:cyclic nucleotide-binding domain-containing protein n=1 Tax=Streptomyces sp. NPDC005507 TaxID=3154885 RepID=UPI0033B7DFF0
MEDALEANFPAGARSFREGGRANIFWMVRSGAVAVAVGLRVSGRQPAVIEILGPCDPVGCSWLFQLHCWHLSVAVMTPLRTDEFERRSYAS